MVDTLVSFKGSVFDPTKYQQIKNKVLRRVVPEAVQIYKANAPVDTGFLVSQIVKLDFYTVGFLAPYTKFVNYGTQFQKAQYFVEGAEEQVTKILDFYTEKYFAEELSK
jgi:HK97 gp10 family phage protein